MRFRDGYSYTFDNLYHIDKRVDRPGLRPTLGLILILLPLAAPAQFQNFLKARGDKLMDGSAELRFVSYNIPNLHYIEDNHQFSQVNPWRIADEFEIRDALSTIRQTGGNVTRMYVPSVRKAIDDSTIVRHVLAPGVFNEEAFRAYDRILQVANQTGVRVIIPLVDNWWWWGGPKEYAAFRGKTRDEFWTDPTLIADFEKTVAFIINRVNTYTGVPFREDRAIFGWETGNELVCPYSWTREIAAYIKSLDTNHIVMEGTNSGTVSDDALGDRNIDVVSTHHYSPVGETLPKIFAARAKTRNRKPYFIGEFGFIPAEDMRRIIDTVISEGISGIMVWSLRTHNRDGGFYYHENAYRWPGFESGKAWNEQAVTRLFAEKAYQINGRMPEPLLPPAVPKLLPIESPWKISWQGSAGASSYMIERKADDETLPEVIAAKASDADIGYRPLYSDTTAQPGKRYTYRIRARNSAGYSDLSDPAGPVTAGERMLIDELENSSKWYASSGNLIAVPPRDAARAREDRSRMEGKTGDYILYRLPGEVTAFSVDLFAPKKDADTTMGFQTGRSPDSLSSLTALRQVFEPFRNEYGAYTAVRYSGSHIPEGDRCVKILFGPDCQVARIEITYR
jgi:mannan endo-1,4-beta-mannosidase